MLTILNIICALALGWFSFLFGAVIAMAGAYIKIEQRYGKDKAQKFLDFMKTKAQ